MASDQNPPPPLTLPFNVEPISTFLLLSFGGCCYFLSLYFREIIYEKLSLRVSTSCDKMSPLIASFSCQSSNSSLLKIMTLAESLLLILLGSSKTNFSYHGFNRLFHAKCLAVLLVANLCGNFGRRFTFSFAH